MRAVIQAVDHLGKEVSLPAFTEVPITEVISVTYRPNNDPEDGSPSELELKVRVAG